MVHYLLIWAWTLKREEGQDLAEYALLISLISVALVAIMVLMRSGIGAVFQRVVDVLANELT
jgi:Flp pilus assembly pilin Flp